MVKGKRKYLLGLQTTKMKDREGEWKRRKIKWTKSAWNAKSMYMPSKPIIAKTNKEEKM